MTLTEEEQKWLLGEMMFQLDGVAMHLELLEKISPGITTKERLALFAAHEKDLKEIAEILYKRLGIVDLTNIRTVKNCRVVMENILGRTVTRAAL